MTGVESKALQLALPIESPLVGALESHDREQRAAGSIRGEVRVHWIRETRPCRLCGADATRGSLGETWPDGVVHARCALEARRDPQ